MIIWWISRREYSTLLCNSNSNLLERVRNHFHFEYTAVSWEMEKKKHHDGAKGVSIVFRCLLKDCSLELMLCTQLNHLARRVYFGILLGVLLFFLCIIDG
ncbi:hypothetical protein M5689_019335 [Euphorbia peplus]|nr:hypothetical protein M5689_019335 [Euphorbia peplus]